MGPNEARDLVFAGAGILWGAVTVYRGMYTWQQVKTNRSFPVFVFAGALLAVGCISYIIHRI